MPKGHLNLVLHAHLPYVRHPEHEYFLEENWLYEAIAESYIPLLDVFDRLINDNVRFRITFSLSPALVEMFNDRLLRDRCLRHMNNLVELTEKEMLRTKGNHSFEQLAWMYNDRFRRIRFLYDDVYKKDLTSAFRKLQDSGKVEIITSAATHAYLPAWSIYPQAVRAQIKVAVESHLRNFGRKPAGIWLPECGYFPGVDEFLKESGIRFFFTESHGILNGAPSPRYGVYRPVVCPSGVVAFGRDIESSREVWSAQAGYPGDPDYRDFYRDIGYDLPLDYLGPHIHPEGVRTYTGIKYHRITGKTDEKAPYAFEKALQKAEEHAGNFILNRKRHIEFLHDTSKFDPLITAPYDAELFGHWWFEGPEWLELILRKASGNREVFRTSTPPEFINENPVLQCVTPSLSSWGQKGYSEVWLNSSNNWIYRHLHKSVERMTEISTAFPSAKGTFKRILDQAAREVLLSQHSDWAFIMKSGSAPDYASGRITGHMERFNILYDAAKKGRIDEDVLSELEARDSIFPYIDYRVYSDQESSLSKG